MKKSLRTKIIVCFSSILLISSLLISYLSYSSSIELVEDSLGQVAGKIVLQAADSINVDQYENITRDSGETAYYHELREELNELRETAGLTYLYTMSRQQIDGKYEYYYMVDGMPPGSEEASSLGDKEEEISSFPAIVDTFEKQSLQVAMTNSDEWSANLSAYVPIKSKSGEVIGIVGADFDVTEAYQTMNKFQVKFLVMLLLILALSGILIFFFSHYLLKPLKVMVNQVKKIGDGDLTSQIKVKSSDELGVLGDAINRMQENLKDTVYNISLAADSVSSQSEELMQSSSEVKQGSIQIASTMQELSSAMDTQAKETNQLSHEMEDFTLRIKDVKTHGNSITTESRQVLELANEGSELMNTSMKQMDIINEIVKDSVTKVQHLNSQSKDISTIVEVINAIANQTNLLALNAAIEAARAGEQGKGFAVVAGEVRSLAEQVSKSVQDITQIVENIQSESTNMVSSLEDGYSKVQEGSSQFQLTQEAFSKITQSITSMNDNLLFISENLEGVFQNTDNIKCSIDNISANTDEAAAGVEQTTASIQQGSASMEDITGNADDLAALAENLNMQVKKFNL
ncbi:methyl-accepting chemotaxis protein [Cytobacillus firmus]|uniref:methyl-accepting chemotaxis protein n=1 Tax=Cytobacillus firmus TaxID=1399 RepID=UPI001C8E86B0|nr:HAMP domain-containing methyl-accepting chemotaxis protein [Cytobacillus firmus]MBX9975131.1 methyl-accepting chemotaxis protein [Cytobacillus firmus]